MPNHSTLSLFDILGHRVLRWIASHFIVCTSVRPDTSLHRVRFWGHCRLLLRCTKGLARPPSPGAGKVGFACRTPGGADPPKIPGGRAFAWEGGADDSAATDGIITPWPGLVQAWGRSRCARVRFPSAERQSWLTQKSHEVEDSLEGCCK